jgi:hypothetical protein
MAKEFTERFRLNYTCTEKQTGDTNFDLDINFENPKDVSKVASRLQTWLNAIGYSQIEVKVK